jgi:hypothetical protein
MRLANILSAYELEQFHDEFEAYGQLLALAQQIALGLKVSFGTIICSFPSTQNTKPLSMHGSHLRVALYGNGLKVCYG